MKLFSIILAFLFLQFAQAQDNKGQVIRVAASIAAIENIFNKVKGPFEKATGIKIEVKEIVASLAVKEIIDGRADLAVNSISVPLIEAGIQKEYPDFKKLPSNLVRSVIGRDQVQLIVNVDSKVSELTHDQVVKVTSGDAQNWKEVGGADLPIKYIKIKASSGTFWQTEVLKGREVRKQDANVDSISQITEAVGNLKGSFCIVPQGTKLNTKTMKPKIPVYGRPVQAWTLGAPSEAIKKFYEFLRTEGKNYLDKE